MEKHNLDLLQVLAYSPLATAIYDNSNLRIAFASRVMLDIWCASSDIVGRPLGDVFPSFKEEGFVSILEKVWHNGITYQSSDTPAFIVDGAERHLRYFDFEYKPLLDAAGNTYAILHTATDVTQHRLDTSRLRVQEEQISFNSDLETLTHTLSHDVKNPLSVAKMGVSFLKHQKDIQPASNLRWYEMIEQALINVENIVNQTVQLSEARLIANIQKVNDLTQEIPTWCEEVKLLHPSFGGTVRLGQLLPVYGNMGALYQIFINIIGNAIKYSASVPAPEIDIYSEKTDKGVAYFIKDNGIGIPESELDKIFCVFRRASNTAEQHGNGIGLCLAKRIIERYSGTINVSSKEGKGTLVRLFFVDQQNVAS